MSAKVDLSHIVKCHLSTLSKREDGKYRFADVFTFFGIPFLSHLATLVSLVDLNKDVINVVVTASAIFTGLLLNLLVLVYDQKSKTPEVDQEDPDYPKVQSKRSLLAELYYNISYATIVAVLLVIFSVVHLIIVDKVCFVFSRQIDLSVVLTSPFIVFFGVNLILTLLMVIKRVYALLVNE